MGAEILLFYLLPVGAAMGFVAIWLTPKKWKQSGPKDYLRMFAVFVLCLFAPVLLLLAVGTLAKYIQLDPTMPPESPIQSMSR